MKLYKSARVWENRLHELIGTKVSKLRKMMVEMEDPSKDYSKADMIVILLNNYWPKEDGDWQMQN